MARVGFRRLAWRVTCALSASRTTAHRYRFCCLAIVRRASIKSFATHASSRRHCSFFSLARCFWTRAFVVIFPPMIPIGLITDSFQETPAREVVDATQRERVLESRGPCA